MLMNITLRNVILNKTGLKSLETNQLTWRLGLSFLGSSNFAICEELLVPWILFLLSNQMGIELIDPHNSKHDHEMKMRPMFGNVEYDWNHTLKWNCAPLLANQE